MILFSYLDFVRCLIGFEVFIEFSSSFLELLKFHRWAYVSVLSSLQTNRIESIWVSFIKSSSSFLDMSCEKDRKRVDMSLVTTAYNIDS